MSGDAADEDATRPDRDLTPGEAGDAAGEAADAGHGTGDALGEEYTPPGAPETWHRLDRRTVLVTALRLVGVTVVAGIPAGLGLANPFDTRLSLSVVLAGAVAVVVVGALVDDVRWRRTRYRVLPERFELRRGLVVRSRRSLNRDRIRSVDITAPLLLRLFGLVHVKIGTAEHADSGESSLALNPVRRGVGEALRRELLSKRTTGRPDAHEPPPGSDVLAALRWSWVRFAPISVLTPALGAAAFGLVFQVAEWFGMRDGVLTWVLDRLRSWPLPTAALAVVLTGLAAGVVGSTAVFVEMWWRYRLEREPGGTLRVRRGLLTTRSISLEERRLRGIELVEPLGNRLLGAARIDAVATGLSRQGSDQRADHKTLLPSAPRWNADRVAAAVLREPVAPTASVRLRAHPRAARGRRVRWALAAVSPPVLVFGILGLTLTPALAVVAVVLALIGVPVAVAAAFDAYANLGHGLTGEYLVARNGAVRRSTVAVRRRGVIGWTARQSFFQRRRGLITLTATTAAGAQAYSVHDVGMSEGLVFAEAAVPDLFGPFLERADAPEPTSAAEPEPPESGREVG